MRDQLRATHLALGDRNLGTLAARACGSSMSGNSEAAWAFAGRVWATYLLDGDVGLVL